MHIKISSLTFSRHSAADSFMLIRIPILRIVHQEYCSPWSNLHSIHNLCRYKRFSPTVLQPCYVGKSLCGGRYKRVEYTVLLRFSPNICLVSEWVQSFTVKEKYHGLLKTRPDILHFRRLASAYTEVIY